MDWSIQLVFEAALQELQLQRMPSLHPGAIDVYEHGATLKMRTAEDEQLVQQEPNGGGKGRVEEGVDRIEEVEALADREVVIKPSDSGHGPACLERNCNHIKEKLRPVPETDERYFYCPEVRGSAEGLHEKSNIYLVANLVVYMFAYSEVFEAYGRLKRFEGPTHTEAYKEMIESLPIASKVQE